MLREDAHPSHDIRVDWDGAPPHQMIIRCEFCGMTSCGVCRIGASPDDGGLAAECEMAPAGYRDPKRRLELEVILDDIAKPPQSPWYTSGMSFQFGRSVQQISRDIQYAQQMMTRLTSVMQLPPPLPDDSKP